MTDVWDKLKAAVKPIVLYGMGDGAVKILNIFQRLGIKTAGIFASDEFVRGHSFLGYKIYTYSDICKKYDDFIIITAFATSLPRVMDRIYTLAQKHELYAPDVPVAGGDLFNMEFYLSNLKKIDAARDLLEDKKSIEIYNDIIDYRLSGDVSLLQKTSCEKIESWEILNPQNFTSYADIGAYNGDTIREILTVSDNIDHIVALEPDSRNFKKLVNYINENACRFSGINVELHNTAAWNENTVLPFDIRGGRNSKPADKSNAYVTVKAEKLDSILHGSTLRGRKIDYIKYDVEGAEAEALQGSESTIKKYSPSLTVSIYHRPGDIFNLIEYVHDLNPKYKLYIRRFPYIPAWDLNLYAVI